MFEEGGALDEDTVAGRDGDGGDGGGRGGENERAGAGSDEDGEGGRQVATGEPSAGGDHQDGGHVLAGVAFEQAGDGGLGALGRAHEADDFTERRAVADGVDDGFDAAVGIDRAGEERLTRGYFDRGRTLR